VEPSRCFPDLVERPLAHTPFGGEGNGVNRDESAVAVSRPLIAVFGPNKAAADEREAARLFGRSTAREGAIVLTGGEWTASPAEIKDNAIAAADGGSASADTPVWIGVANETSPTPWEESHRGGIVTPGGNHEHNFVEACLCHAAIVIGTGDGTASEAPFALYLNRPVAMVTAGDPLQRDTTMQALETAALKRITPTELQDPVRRGIRLAFA